jgi:hypothetical protein
MDNLEQRLAQQDHAEKPTDAPTAETAEVVTQTIEQIKRTLLDPHAISQKYDSESRQAVEAEISEVRTRAATVGEGITGKTESLGQKEQKARELNALKAEKVLVLEQRLETVAARLKKLFRVKDKSATEIQSEIEIMESEMEEVIGQTLALRGELEKLAQDQAELPDPEKMLEAYYNKMETMPLSNEEKRELLRPEVLAELSTDEYIALWRRLNPHFLTHVTGQGFRDHNAAWFHSGGMHELCDGFRQTLQDEKLLRSPMGIRDLRSRDETTIRSFLEGWALKAETKREALDRLNAQLHHSWASAPNYPDKTAVHFATQLVADGFYGGERNNEIFFIYPSDVIASQYDFAFNGSEKDFTCPQSETMWNDVFVWPESPEKPGIPVDSGVVFLPGNTPVDPETGSKYASEVKAVEGEEKRVMIEDEKLVKAFIDWATELNDESPAIQAYREYYEKRNDMWTSREDRQKTCFGVFKGEIMQLGFCEDATDNLISKIFGNDNIGAWAYHGKLGWGASSPEEAALDIVKSASANWKRAENAITAKEYWERYFKQNPQYAPTHVIFYDGDPTTAIYKFQQRHNIGQADTSEKEGTLLGFDDRHVLDMSKDPRANRGYDELVATTHRIIEEHYRTKE